MVPSLWHPLPSSLFLGKYHLFFPGNQLGVTKSRANCLLHSLTQDNACINTRPNLSLGQQQLPNIATFYRYFILFYFSFIFISWRLITLQNCSGFCHTLTWISHGFTCAPHPDPPSHLPLHPIPLGLPSAPGPSTCLMHPTWAGDLFHPR